MSESIAFTDTDGDLAFPSGYYDEQKVDDVYVLSKEASNRLTTDLITGSTNNHWDGTWYNGEQQGYIGDGSITYTTLDGTVTSWSGRSRWGSQEKLTQETPSMRFIFTVGDGGSSCKVYAKMKGKYYASGTVKECDEGDLILDYGCIASASSFLVFAL